MEVATGLTTVIFTTEEVVESPQALATALMAYEPAGAPPVMNVKGEVVTVPKEVLLLRKNVTFVTARDPGQWHGDYLGLALAPSGELWATWSDTRTGTPNMFLSRGRVP